MFRWVDEPTPGDRWLELFQRAWPAYRAWFLSEGDDARPDLVTCRAELNRYMPEMVSLWQSLVELAGGDPVVGRMLSMVDPPPYVTGCSQVVRTGSEPMLIRNYDYRPDACEGLFLRSRWRDVGVIASSDCLWGALDGMNEHGLCVALAFGGSRRVGPGFGIPVILRYVLESCTTVDEAAAILRRIPSHMAYNVSLLDARGDYALAYLAPDRPPEVVRERACTNHQRRVEWREYAELTGSERRKRYLEKHLDSDEEPDDFVRRFLKPPLFVDSYERGYGTLYTAAYSPDSGSVDFLWRDARARQSFDSFTERTLTVRFDGTDEGVHVPGPLIATDPHVLPDA